MSVTERTIGFANIHLYFKNIEEAREYWKTKLQFFEDHGYILHIESLSTPNGMASSGSRRTGTLRLFNTSDSDLVGEDISSRIDATRVRDGLPVCIKRVAQLGSSHRLLNILHEDANKYDPGNHCVPILDELQDPLNDERGPIGALVTYLIMPILRPVTPGTFKTVGDVVEFTSQLLVGLHYMHRNTIAHRDCSIYNIMVGQDDSLQTRQLPMDSLAAGRDRQDSKVKYYFVGLGGLWDCCGEHTDCVRDRYSWKFADAPELHSWRLMYDPLFLDIFLIGNVLRREILDRYSNVGFLEILVADMTHVFPEERRDAKSALQLWYNILPRISSFQRRRRLHSRTDRRLSLRSALCTFKIIQNKQSGTCAEGPGA